MKQFHFLFLISGPALSLRKKNKMSSLRVAQRYIIKPEIIGIPDLQGGFWKVEALSLT